MFCISRLKMPGSVYSSRRTRSGSTILDRSSRSMGLSYVGFQVGAHALQDLSQGIDLALRQAVERKRVQPLHLGPDALEHPPAARGEREARDAHVLLVRQALPPARFLHPVDGAGEGGAVDGRQVGELGGRTAER